MAPGEISKRVIRSHGKRWRTMGVHRKKVCEDLAAEMQGERKKDIAERMAKEKEALAELRRQGKDMEDNGGSCLRLGRCRFSEADKVDFEKFAESSSWSKATVDGLRAKSAEPVGHPPEPMKAVLETMPLPPTARGPRQPPWLSWCAQNRDFFRTSVWRFRAGGQVSHYRFIYAKQNPIEVCWARVAETECVEPWFDAAGFAQASVTVWDHVFEVSLMDLLYSDDEDFPMDAEVQCLTDMCSRGRFLCGDGRFVSLESLRSLLPGGGTCKEKEQDTGASVAFEPWMEEPALWDFVRDGVGEEQTQVSKRARRSKSVGDALTQVAGASGEIGEDCDAFLDDLIAAREEFGATGGASPEPFAYVLRGGRWTKQAKGVAFDSFRALTAGSAAKQFCMLFRMSRSATYSIRAYGEDSCVALCNLWIHKMTYFFRLWEGAGCSDKYAFDEQDLRAYVAPSEAGALRSGAEDSLIRRLEAIEALRPRRR